MADKNFDASDKTIYLLPIKLFQVCLLSSNQEGLYIKVKNDDFVGEKKTIRYRPLLRLLAMQAHLRVRLNFYLQAPMQTQIFQCDSQVF